MFCNGIVFIDGNQIIFGQKKKRRRRRIIEGMDDGWMDE
jgi:hypothetical protein